MIRCIREYSYKTVKRPDFTSSSKNVDRKFKEDYNLQQILRAKIELSGPITGNYKLFIKCTT